MMHRKLTSLVSLFTLTLLLGGALVSALPAAYAADGAGSIISPGSNGGINIGGVPCDPAKSPAKGGCGLTAFEALLQRGIDIILILIVPIAAIFIIWGAFVIMTANGSSEKVKSGTSKIKIAIVGIVIVLISFFVVRFVFNILGVENNFRPGGVGPQPTSGI